MWDGRDPDEETLAALIAGARRPYRADERHRLGREVVRGIVRGALLGLGDERATPTLIDAVRARRVLEPPLTPREILAFLTAALAVRPDLPEREAANLLLHAGAGPGLWAKARALLERTPGTPPRRFANTWMR